MHFIFDCDDVLLDWQGGFVHWLGWRRIYPDPAGPDDWNLAKWIGCRDDEAKDLIAEFNNSKVFPMLAANPGATEAIWALHDAGHSLSVMTCCGTQPRVRHDRVRNLHREFSRDSSGPPWLRESSVITLPLGGSKEAALYKLCCEKGSANLAFVEDNLSHAITGANLGIRSFCIRRSHNRALEATREVPSLVTWIDDIRDLLGVYA